MRRLHSNKTIQIVPADDRRRQKITNTRRQSTISHFDSRTQFERARFIAIEYIEYTAHNEFHAARKLRLTNDPTAIERNRRLSSINV